MITSSNFHYFHWVLNISFSIIRYFSLKKNTYKHNCDCLMVLLCCHILTIILVKKLIMKRLLSFTYPFKYIIICSMPSKHILRTPNSHPNGKILTIRLISKKVFHFYIWIIFPFDFNNGTRSVWCAVRISGSVT